MDGLLLVDKPANMTSHDVVSNIRKSLKGIKVGHAGTLDPFATGLLLVGIGRATRLMPFLTSQSKTYNATLRLGRATDTQDCDGVEILTQPIPDGITSEFLANVFEKFLGKRKQIPPMYSAIKIDGHPLYEYARLGKEVERPPRDITIEELNLLSLSLPDIVFESRCSKGTYIRTLGLDIAETIGTVGHLVSLRRTESSGYNISSAHSLDNCLLYSKHGRLNDLLIPIDDMLQEIPCVEVSLDEATRIKHGQAIRWKEVLSPSLNDGVKSVQLPAKSEDLIRIVSKGELQALAVWEERFISLRSSDSDKERVKKLIWGLHPKCVL